MRLAGIFLCFLAVPVWAEDRALLIGNETYAEAARIPGAAAIPDAVPALRTAGFRVLAAQDQTADDMRGLLSGLLAESVGDGRLVILLAGHFAQSGGQTWFLGTETDTPDMATVAAEGIDLNDILALAARSPGGAIVLLGHEDRRLVTGPGLSPGIGALTPPQGVTLAHGDAETIAAFAAGPLMAQGQSLATMLADSDLQASGFLAPLVPFRPGGDVTRPAVAGPDPEETLWQATRAIATVEAYQAYLARYPEGRHAADAQTSLARLLAEPQREARLAEEALALGRDTRRGIQESLALLGFDPRGIDGVFGQGSRTAITQWQERFGHAETGYLTREQIVQLTSQAERRRAERAAEEAARAATAAAEDRAFWDQTGKSGDEAGLRAYLGRYPAGLFASLAQDRLAVIDAARAAEQAAADRAAWDAARAGNDVAAYEDYLAQFPQGAFATQAAARIAALNGTVPADDAGARAQSAELSLQLSPAARTLIEGRLNTLGLQTGPVDGQFDAETRAALRAFQAQRSLPVTGFLDEQTMVGLMAGGILDLQ
jgi:peptidoglycan hydrolase-like protein with peptidoglycan-binding domain